MKKHSLFLLLLSLLFVSCNDMLNTESKDYISVSGVCSFAEEGAMPSQISEMLENRSVISSSRTASYSLPASIGYKVIFEDASSNEFPCVVNADGSYTKLLEKGIYTACAIAYNTADDSILGQSEISTGVSLNDGSLDNLNFVIKPKQTTTGDISLNVNVYDNTKIKSLVYDVYNSSGSVAGTTLNYIGGAISSITCLGVISGSYFIDIDFYSEADGTGIKVYTIKKQALNVFDNMVTNFWYGTAEYISSGKILITEDCYKHQMQKDFYVSSSGNATNSGTYFDPLPSIQAAVDKITSVNDTTTEYTIYLKDNISASADSDFTDFSTVGYSLAVINPGSTLKLSIKPYSSSGNITINAGRTSSSTVKARNFYVSSDVTLTMERLVIKGGYISDKYGGGLYCDSGKVTIKNCTFEGNTALYGGALYINTNSEVAVSDSLIGKKLSSVSSCATSTKYSNSSINAGGAVFIEGGSGTENKISFKNTDVVYNYSGSSGGGIDIASKQIRFIHENGNISYNGANENGGGIVCYDGYTGGLYTELNDVTMTGNQAYGNKSGTGNGGAILVPNAGRIYLNDCTIKNNTAKLSGGGIYSGAASTTVCLGGLTKTSADTINVIITNNKADSVTNNVLVGGKIKVACNLGDSSIGLTGASTLTYPAAITSDYGTNNKVSGVTIPASKNFFSDDNHYEVDLDSDEVNLLVKQTSGTLSVIDDDVTFVINKSSISAAADATLTIKAYKDYGSASQICISEKVSDSDKAVNVYQGLTDVSSVTGITVNYADVGSTPVNPKITIKKGTLGVSGSTFRIYVQLTYNGMTYSGNFNMQVED